MYGTGNSLYAHVSVWGWVLAGLSAMVVGMLWYSPWLFGKQWSKAIGVSEKEMAAQRPKVVPILLLMSFLTAYVLSLVTVYIHSYVGNSWMTASFDAAVLAWVGFAGTAIVAHGLWDEPSRKTLYINLGNRLVTLVVMGLIIGSFLK